jgi:hypothetical protein
MTEAFLQEQQRAFSKLRGCEGRQQHAAIFRLALALLEGPCQQ